MGIKTKKQPVYFGGKIANFKDEAERAFEQKHLRAFLKGWQRFIHGKNLEGKPIWHNVKRSSMQIL